MDSMMKREPKLLYQISCYVRLMDFLYISEQPMFLDTKKLANILGDLTLFMDFNFDHRLQHNQEYLDTWKIARYIFLY